MAILEPSNRTAIVTGGSQGIGLAIARRLRRDGYRVGIIARDPARLRGAAGTLGDTPWFAADLSQRADAVAAMHSLISSLGRLDVLVNNTGLARSVSAADTLDDAELAWDAVMCANLKSMFLATMAAMPHLRHAGARVINIGSIAAQSGSSSPGGLAYAAAKAGVQGFSASLARELAQDGVTVNTVVPGLIAGTGFFGPKGLTDEKRNTLVSQIPVGRPGDPDDVAAAVAWLASEESSFVTGAAIPVNGGWRIG